MITNLLLSILAAPGASAPPALPVPTPRTPAGLGAFVQDDEIDSAKEIATAGEDLEKVLQLARTWKADGKSAEAKAAFMRAVELDDTSEEAHKGLRHHFYDNQWFTTYSAMSKYRRAETKKKAEEGFSRLGDEWVLTVDVPYLRMGWEKSSAGKWLDPELRRQAEHKKTMIKEGRQLRKEDGTWVHPDDFEKWTEGLWKCGEDWVTTEQANAYHSEVGQWWEAQTDNFEVRSTCSMETLTGWGVLWTAEQTYRDLVKIYGIKPATRPTVVVFKDIAQFNSFAAGEANVRQPAEASGFSSLHYAYFADAWYDVQSQPPRYLGTGVGYWDASDPGLAPWGKHSVRHAAGLAYVEKISPSLDTLSTAIAAGAPPDLGSFWAEKPIPRWLFYGGASYVERYFRDGNAENPWWPREWSVSNLRPVDEEGKPQEVVLDCQTVFAFELTLDDIPTSTRRISEAGLLVSFILDGGCAPVIGKHRAYKAALRKGEGTTEAIAALQQEIINNKDALQEYIKGT